ncbi:centrosomal protein of 70 kDa-like isoform X2 [Oncorhynchus keta]|uniref:centrosomal protein of 70 kDa-like isoform X2 n=1 Tax=Oncorhynchus keta TaxID=8018 RepID=UPI00227D2484|nr:centrosomal protein of 70 kDa-like isoform X2 [Oncorhynchus keta]
MDRENTNAVFHSRDETYVFLWTYSLFQQEQTEWDAVNSLLQHHGFKPVHFADPVANKNLADLERRHTLIQELIESNNQLKVLDVIDIYEAQMEQLCDDVESLKADSGDHKHLTNRRAPPGSPPITKLS